jgi:methionyl-tRNA formyltransferase
MKKISDLKIVFFGTGPLAESALTTLVQGGIPISLLVTKADSLVGRKQLLTSPHIVSIASSLGIAVIQPKSLRRDVPIELLEGDFDLAIVASYGNILPEAILDIPLYGTLNIHPSLLPLYRGPTPIESALRNGDPTLGISIMFLDMEVDHGPILAQKVYYDFDEVESGVSTDFEYMAGAYGAAMLVDGLLQDFVSGAVSVTEQDHSRATFTRKFTKEDGQITLDEDIHHIWNVYRACTPWPGCYFMHTHNDRELRIKISEMQYVEGAPAITKVVPEGKNEMSWESFQNGYTSG